MKHLSLFIIVFWGVLMTSCKTNPNTYQDEIEAVVRFQLAVFNSITLCDNVSDFMEFYDWAMALSNHNAIREHSFRDLLVEQSASNAFNKKVLELYDTQKILLSELQPTMQKNVWTFTELNSGVDFTFELIPVQGGDMYYRCAANEDDIESILKKAMQKKFWDILDLY